MTMARNSSYYRGLLTAGARTAAQKVIDIEEEKFGIPELWFRAFHNAPISPSSYGASIESLWDVIHYGQHLRERPQRLLEP